MTFASQRKDDFVKMVMDADMRQRNRGLAKRKKTLADAEKRIAELDLLTKAPKTPFLCYNRNEEG